MTAVCVDARRVVILAPTGRDAALTADVLRGGSIDSLICPDFQAALSLIENADALLVAEEALDHSKLNALAGALRQQPAWSDVPVLLVARHQADSTLVESALSQLGNITLLERPVRPATIISAARTALKSRARQYEVRAHLEERERNERALQAADKRKDEFLATLAHELRNPLAAIRNSLHILRLSADLDPDVKLVSDTLERQTGLLVRLVEDLLEVSRITQGRVELRKEPVELAAVIKQAVELSKPHIDRGDHNLTVTLPPEAVMLDADPTRLSQVFCNLLNNAAKYMNSGGQIWLTARRKADTIEVSIKDAGIGIPEDKLPQVFEIFTQIDRTSRQSQGGLGIGLSLVKALVELHGGKVEARSGGMNQGSEFVVELPLSSENSVQQGKANVAGSSVPSHRRVLVVDDNRDAASTLGMLLRLLGADTEIAHDGAGAIERMKSFRPGVVFLDIGMPIMNGYEVARRIRSEPEFNDVVLIALTGWGQEQDRRHSAQAGFNHHLTKPADMKEITSLLALNRD